MHNKIKIHYTKQKQDTFSILQIFTNILTNTQMIEITITSFTASHFR